MEFSPASNWRSEARNAKSEIRNHVEILNSNALDHVLNFWHLTFEFVSRFDIRVSDILRPSEDFELFDQTRRNHQMRILVTGGCGFIGSNFIRHMLERDTPYEIINLPLPSLLDHPFDGKAVVGHVNPVAHIEPIPVYW